MALTASQHADAQLLYEFHRLEYGADKPASVVLACGSHDLRVAEHAASLMLSGLGGHLVTSGGSGKVTATQWSRPEGERFAEIAVAAGVPVDRVVIEDRAANTGENVTFSRAALEARGISTDSVLLVTKPYMQRRAYATAAKQWPGPLWGVTGPPIGYEDYPTHDVPLVRMINLMVGDLQRLRVYAEKGFQVPQDVPDTVWAAYERLAAVGFDQFVIR